MNHYEKIDVPENISQDDLKKRYKKLCFDLHPDRHQQDTRLPKFEQAFKNLQEVWRILGDPAKRREYDGFLAAQRQTVMTFRFQPGNIYYSGGFDWGSGTSSSTTGF